MSSDIQEKKKGRMKNNSYSTDVKNETKQMNKVYKPMLKGQCRLSSAHDKGQRKTTKRTRRLVFEYHVA